MAEFWLPYSAAFTIYPFEVILRNVQALCSIPFGNCSAEVYLFPGCPSLLQFFFGHSHNQMVYNLGTYLHKYLSPYLLSERTKNNTSLLYQDKSGFYASMYPLYGIQMPPIPSRCNTPPSIPQWKNPQPHFCTESLSEGID